jgi:ketosteroid isomerase-like protein
MSTTKENQINAVEIERLLRQLAKAHADHYADAIVEAYAPDAVIFDLAPPLGRRGMDRESVAAWLAGWDGPIRIDARDVNLAVDGDLAIVSARMQGAAGCRRAGHVVPHHDVSSEDNRAMENRL